MPAPEGFAAYPFGQDAPGVRWFSVTPSDTESLTALPRCLYVGGNGRGWRAYIEWGMLP